MDWRHTRSKIRAAMGIVHGSRAFGGPLQANLNIINRCNLRCVHCFYNSPYVEKPAIRSVRRARREDGALPRDEEIKRVLGLVGDPGRIRTLIDEFVAMGTRRFQFSGMGEVFLNEHVLEFMGRAKRAGCYCVANTNGTLLTRESVDELIRMRFDNLRVSTMAGTADLYVKTHPGVREDTFERLKENLLSLKDRKRALGVKRPKIVLCCTVISLNHEGLFDFARFARDIGADRVQYHPFDLVEDSQLARLALSIDEAASVREQLHEVKHFLDAENMDHNIGNFLKVSFERLDTTEMYRHIPCYYGWLATRIGLEGDVFSCCRCFQPLGNIFERPFREIWNGTGYRRFRREAKTIHKRKAPVTNCDCSSCVHHHANLRVYRLLHPVRGISSRIENISPRDSSGKDACKP